MSSSATMVIQKAQCVITDGAAEFQNRYSQLKENATTEKVKENYEQMIVEVRTRLDSLLKLMKELVEATQTEAKTFEKSKAALEATQKKVSSLIAKFEALLKDLQQKMSVMYVTYVPEGRRQEISKFLEGSTKQLNEGLLQVKDAYKAKEQQGVAHYAKVAEWATEKSNEVQAKVNGLTDEHVKPRLASAKEALSNYSPDAMEKADEGIAALMDSEGTYFARLTAFLYIMFHAVVTLVRTKPPVKKSEEAKVVEAKPEPAAEESKPEQAEVKPEPVAEDITEAEVEEQEEEEGELEVEAAECDSPVTPEGKKSPDSAPKTPKTSTHS